MKMLKDLREMGENLPGFDLFFAALLRGKSTEVVYETKSKIEAELIKDRYEEYGFISSVRFKLYIFSSNYYHVIVTLPEKGDK